ncbi:DNA-3-methyladenine glycosylase 2 [Dokdonella fugitiva]|uniref:DNA-3-methyladenine glycosylase II n=1 Tax=Dokdonella fugitiva TaxID=328517 RepID=A0A4R2IAE1_9GAMM|nr:DNA-3-methyladenine glycosylase 2 [Dokdonella fugitiva]TCO41431.1 DNA-3-methyladenine glycosylase II [Dokdonella fugitiva]
MQAAAVPATSLDPRVCDQARLTRDARFDGLFYVAVTSTGIYCRPVCPAPSPRVKNIRYYDSAAAAAAAGFRPCLRCRPEAAPGSPLHRAKSELVAGALRLIEQGALDDGSLPELAARVGVGERHLRRVFAEELGASPLDVAATRRLLFAKQLLTETAMPIARIAEASGYASLRRFNAAFVATYGKPPRDFRRGRAAADAGADELVLRLPYRAPYDFDHLLGFYGRRTIPGVEAVDDRSYRRSVVVAGVPGWFDVAALPGDDALALRVHHPSSSAVGTIVARVKRMFDVDADPRALELALRGSALLKPLVRRWPGQRLPGAWDGFELAVRAVLGQQVSVAAARTFAARVAATYGTPYADGEAHGVGVLFPTPERLVDAPLEQQGIIRARASTIRGIARAVLDGRLAFRAEQPLAAFERDLVALPGIGAWTAHYIAMRALAQPDAFPAADLILRRAAGQGRTLSTRELERLGENWRPWRAYAVMLLWRSS